MISFLIGAAIGALIGAAVVLTIDVCIEIAQRIFNQTPNATHIDVVKKESKTFKRLVNRIPAFRDAVKGNPNTTAATFTYHRNGDISMEIQTNEVDSEFGDGYRVRRENPTEAKPIVLFE